MAWQVTAGLHNKSHNLEHLKRDAYLLNFFSLYFPKVVRAKSHQQVPPKFLGENDPECRL